MSYSEVCFHECSGVPPETCDQGLNNQNCKCDSSSHVGVKVQNLGQQEWATITMHQLAQIDIKVLHNKCQDLLRFMNKQESHTGFIPLSPLQFTDIRKCNKCAVDPELCKDPIKLYEYVSSFRCPNFLGAHIQVNFDMNLDLIDSLAQDYWDWQLPLYLRYGFPMDFKGDHGDLVSTTESHDSAHLFSEHVSMYLQDEIQHKAIYGTFNSKPFGETTHTSPFITRTKQDSDERRVIIDLS